MTLHLHGETEKHYSFLITPFMVNTAKKPSLADLKAKAGKAFLDMNAVNGGVLADCHPGSTLNLPPISVPPVRTDNV